MKSFEEVLSEANKALPTPVTLAFVNRGESLYCTFPLPLGNSAYAWRGQFILIDKTENDLTKLALLYHELGHLWSDLKYKRETALERELDADEWAFSKMIEDGNEALVRAILLRKKEMLLSGEAKGVYIEVTQKQLSDPKWGTYAG